MNEYHKANKKALMLQEKVIEKLQTALAEAREEIERYKNTNQRLNRRTQEAESALGEWQKISEFTKHQSTHRFFPAMMRYALTKANEENERLKEGLNNILNDGFCEASARFWAEQALKEKK